MERSKTEQALEDLLPELEKEHDAEEDETIRDVLWNAINAIEELLLERQDARRRQNRTDAISERQEAEAAAQEWKLIAEQEEQA